MQFDFLPYSELKKMALPVMILAVVAGLSGLVISNWLSIFWLLLGGIIGLLLLKVDEKYLLVQYRLDENDTNLVTRSPLFLLVYAGLAIYILTSTDQFIGYGVIFGIGIGVLFEGWRLVGTPTLFLERFTGLLEKSKLGTVSYAQLLRIMIIATAYMLVLYIWWLFGN